MNEREMEGEKYLPVHEKVRQLAYELWLKDGQVDGRDLDHWREAEREVAQ